MGGSGRWAEIGVWLARSHKDLQTESQSRTKAGSPRVAVCSADVTQHQESLGLRGRSADGPASTAAMLSLGTRGSQLDAFPSLSGLIIPLDRAS